LKQKFKMFKNLHGIATSATIPPVTLHFLSISPIIHFMAYITVLHYIDLKILPQHKHTCIFVFLKICLDVFKRFKSAFNAQKVHFK
jgi:hypothetical protein